MKLVWHLFRKDFARVKLPAAALLLLAALRPLLGLIALAQEDIDYRETSPFENLDAILFLIHAAGAWLLTLWLAQLDSPRRPDAFLHTRPVSRAALWSAKLLGAWTLCAFAPLLAWLPWWLGCGMTGPDLRSLIATHAGGLALLVTPALVLGALVRDYRRAVLWSIAFALVVLCLPVLFSYAGEMENPFGERTRSMRFGGWLLFGFAASLGLLGLLYRRHPGRTGFAAWAVGLIALGCVFYQTRWPATDASIPRGLRGLPTSDWVAALGYESGEGPWWREHNAAAVTDLRFKVASLKRRASMSFPSDDGEIEFVPLDVNARVTGAGAAGLCLIAEFETLTLTPRDGPSMRIVHDFLGHDSRTGDLADNFTRSLFSPSRSESVAGAPLAGEMPAHRSYHLPLRFDAPDEPLTVHGTIRASLYRPVLVARHPLAPTGWHRANGIGYRIRKMTDGKPVGELEIVEARLAPTPLWKLWRWFDQPLDPWGSRFGVYDAQGHPLWISTVRLSDYTAAGVRVTHLTHILQPPSLSDEDGEWHRITPTPEWRAGLSYAAVRLDPVARVRRELVTTDLRIEREN